MRYGDIAHRLSRVAGADRSFDLVGGLPWRGHLPLRRHLRPRAFDDLRARRARRLVKPGDTFGRIHRDDIARAVVAAMPQDRLPRRQVLNLVDNESSESAMVVTEAAKLLGVTPPPFVPFEVAFRDMSPMARSFWAENRKVASLKNKAALGIG